MSDDVQQEAPKSVAQALGLDKPTVPPPVPQVRLVCPKHGDISNATLHIVFDPSTPESKPTRYMYCLHCLNEVLLSLQKDKLIEAVQVIAVPAPEVPPTEPVQG